eukprot:gene17583-biopygen2340
MPRQPWVRVWEILTLRRNRVPTGILGGPAAVVRLQNSRVKAARPGRNGHARVRSASVSSNSIVCPASGPRPVSFSAGGRRPQEGEGGATVRPWGGRSVLSYDWLRHGPTMDVGETPLVDLPEFRDGSGTRGKAMGERARQRVRAFMLSQRFPVAWKTTARRAHNPLSDTVELQSHRWRLTTPVFGPGNAKSTIFGPPQTGGGARKGVRHGLPESDLSANDRHEAVGVQNEVLILHSVAPTPTPSPAHRAAAMLFSGGKG